MPPITIGNVTLEQQERKPPLASARPPQQSPLVDDFNNLFPILQPFRDNFKLALARNGSKNIPVTEHLQRFANFLSPSNTLNLLALKLQTNDFQHDFMLKAFQVYDQSVRKLALQQQDVSHMVCLAHLCGAEARYKGAQPKILVLDLLSQMLEHQQRVNSKGHLLDGLGTEDDNLNSHFTSLQKCIRDSGVKYLLILLDEVDALFEECHRLQSDLPLGFEPAMDQWECLVDNLKTLPSQLEGTTVKIVVTSGKDHVKERFTTARHNNSTRT